MDEIQSAGDIILNGCSILADLVYCEYVFTNLDTNSDEKGSLRGPVEERKRRKQ